MVGTENLRKIIDQICRDKGIERAMLIDAIEEAVRSAAWQKAVDKLQGELKAVSQKNFL